MGALLRTWGSFVIRPSMILLATPGLVALARGLTLSLGLA